MKKAWTPDHCPLQVGSVVHDSRMDADRMVTRRYFNFDDCADEDKELIVLDNGAGYSGKELMKIGFTYYPEWPCTLDEKPCYDEVEVEVEEKPDYAKLVHCIFEGLKESKYAVKDLHYKQDGDCSVWGDGLATAVNNAAGDLAKIFKEFKHDEQ